MDLLKYFSKREFVSILELVEDSRVCSTRDEARSIILKAAGMLSADYSVSATADLSSAAGAGAADVINGGYPGEWLDHYLRERLYRFDPVVRYHRRFSLSMTWPEINKRFDDREAGLVVKGARDFGLNYGISSSVFSPLSGKMTLFCFAAEKDNFHSHHKRILDTISLHLNTAMNSTVHGTPPYAWAPEEDEATFV